MSSKADAFAAAANAVKRRDFDTLRGLIKHQPALLKQTGKHPSWGGEPQLLHIAIETGDGPIVNFLLEAGADPSGTNDRYDGWSPLMLAVRWKRTGIRDGLIARGATIGLYEALPATYARLGDLKSLKLFKPDWKLFNPAIEGGQPRVVKWLIDSNIDVNEADEKGVTTPASP